MGCMLSAPFISQTHCSTIKTSMYAYSFVCAYVCVCITLRSSSSSSNCNSMCILYGTTIGRGMRKRLTNATVVNDATAAAFKLPRRARALATLCVMCVLQIKQMIVFTSLNMVQHGDCETNHVFC